jgi:hypothetical protein
MVDFFKELEKAKKHLDEIAKEWEPKKTKKTPEEKPKEQKSTPMKGFDLRKYLSIEEVAQITDLPIDKYSPYLDEEWKGGVYNSSNPKIHTYFQLWVAEKDVDGYNPDGVLGYFKEVTPNLKAVKGIGDEAYWSDSNAVFFVRKGQDVLQAVTTSDKGLSFEVMKRLVKIILSRV